MTEPMALEFTREEYERIRGAWHERGVDYVLRLAASGKPFSFDMVRRELTAPLHPNHWGQLMRDPRVRDLVVAIGNRPSRIKSRRGGDSSVYILRSVHEKETA